MVVPATLSLEQMPKSTHLMVVRDCGTQSGQGAARRLLRQGDWVSVSPASGAIGCRYGGGLGRGDLQTLNRLFRINTEQYGEVQYLI